MAEHYCGVCGEASGAHPGTDDRGCFHFPPLCCEGCGCRSFEDAEHLDEESGDSGNE